jgi:transposase
LTPTSTSTSRSRSTTTAPDTGGYAQLETWAQALGRIDRFGVEGTGSYGAGLTSYLRRCGHRIIEVNRGDRRLRRQTAV